MEHWIYSFNIGNHVVSCNMDTLITMWITMAILLLAAFVVSRNLSLLPGKLQFAAESLINYFAGVAKASMGEAQAKQHLPLILTLFMFILTANLAGQLPWHLIHLKTGEFASPNNDINMTAAMAIVVSLYYIWYGVKRKGIRFFVHGLSIDGIIITLVDTLELFVRPFSLALRLFANIFAGEVLVFAMVGIFAYFAPLPFMLFELFVALIQALVFTLLSTTYISMAIKEE